MTSTLITSSSRTPPPRPPNDVINTKIPEIKKKCRRARGDDTSSWVIILPLFAASLSRSANLSFHCFFYGQNSSFLVNQHFWVSIKLSARAYGKQCAPPGNPFCIVCSNVITESRLNEAQHPHFGALNLNFAWVKFSPPKIQMNCRFVPYLCALLFKSAGFKSANGYSKHNSKSFLFVLQINYAAACQNNECGIRSTPHL